MASLRFGLRGLPAPRRVVLEAAADFAARPWTATKQNGGSDRRRGRGTTLKKIVDEASEVR